MKIFPTKYYEFKLLTDNKESLSKLKKNTMITDSLISQWTKKIFIGQVDTSGFRIITSKRGYGAFCVFDGELQSKKGTLEIKINKPFRFLLSILLVFPIVGFSISLFTKEIDISISLIIPTLMSLAFTRFILTELAFRLISKNGLNRLKELIGIIEIEEK